MVAVFPSLCLAFASLSTGLASVFCWQLSVFSRRFSVPTDYPSTGSGQALPPTVYWFPARVTHHLALPFCLAFASLSTGLAPESRSSRPTCCMI